MLCNGVRVVGLRCLLLPLPTPDKSVPREISLMLAVFNKLPLDVSLSEAVTELV